MAKIDLKPLPHREAIEYFQSKGYAHELQRFHHLDHFREDHARNWVVSKAMQDDVSRAIREAVGAMLIQGHTMADASQELAPRLQSMGWWGKAEMEDPVIATWPATLPPPQRDSWQLQPQDARRKRQNEAGPPGYRRRFSSVAKSVSMAVKLTHNQRAVFDRFFHETCQEGAIRFWMPDPSIDGWPLTNAAGVGLLVNAQTKEPLLLSERWLCAWGDQLPTETVVDQVKFLKSFQIWVLP